MYEQRRGNKTSFIILYRPCVSWKYGCNVLLMEGCRKTDLSGMSPSSNSTVIANFWTWEPQRQFQQYHCIFNQLLLHSSWFYAAICIQLYYCMLLNYRLTALTVNSLNTKYYRLFKPDSCMLRCLSHGLQQVSMSFWVIQLYSFDTTWMTLWIQLYTTTTYVHISVLHNSANIT